MNPLIRWHNKHADEHGPYAELVGFENDLRAHDDVLADWYDYADIEEKSRLFEFVVKLLEEAEEI
jgi:hypothetical protein